MKFVTDPISKRKRKMLDEFLAGEIKIGDYIDVPKSAFGWTDRDGYNGRVVLGISDDGKQVEVKTYDIGDKTMMVDVDVIKRLTYNVGADPFPEYDWRSNIRDLGYDLECVIHMLLCRDRGTKLPDGTEIVIPEVNWNPFVLDKDGNKLYYQRDFCWTLKDKQLFIESLYNGIDCGKIIMRMNDYEAVWDNWVNGDRSMAWRDIVDGKQRLRAVMDFIEDKFVDMHSNHFSDLSDRARTKLLSHHLIGYAELTPKATDEDVIRTFLMINHAGKPMSKQHIDYVRGLYDKIR